ncbi:uncharacterized protein TNCV_4726571 [Trichonephila clavipes]|nr:uncharacterized protein TNCV_4726571 [Trichonephila clavipes]
MTQRTHFDDLFTCRIIGRLECKRTLLEVSEEFGITQSVISRFWQRFHDDGNVSRSCSKASLRVTTSNEDRYFAVTAKRNRQNTPQTCHVSTLQPLVRQFQGRPCTYA